MLTVFVKTCVCMRLKQVSFPEYFNVSLMFNIINGPSVVKQHCQVNIPYSDILFTFSTVKPYKII